MIDTHTHIYTKEFTSDVNDVILRAKESGVSKILLPNVDVDSLDKIADLCDKNIGVCYPMYGLHPTDMTTDYENELKRIFDFAERRGDMVGVGEIGLDLYWSDELKEEQEKAFRWQVEYALKHDMPMSIHIRNAFGMFWSIIVDYRAEDIKGVLHCFSGTEDDARRVMSEFPNLMFGVNGTITYKKSQLPEIFRKLIPVERFLLETDAPYLSPVPHRGKRNEPSNLIYIRDYLGEIYGVDASVIEHKTDENAKRLFKM